MFTVGLKNCVYRRLSVQCVIQLIVFFLFINVFIKSRLRLNSLTIMLQFKRYDLKTDHLSVGIIVFEEKNNTDLRFDRK